MIAGYRQRWLAESEAARTWTGGYRRYDLVKEVVLAIGAVLAIAIVLTVLFSSPDEKPLTIAQWSRQMPLDFAQTATAELDGSSATATYGPPYNNGTGAVQHEWFIHLQQWLGVSHPINAPIDYVIDPLRSVTGQPSLTRALGTYEHAPAAEQAKWSNAYANALAATKPAPSVSASGAVTVPAGDYGPVPTMIGALVTFAQSGGLDGALLTSRQFFQTDYTKPLLLLADGSLLADRAQADHLLGSQWGMMNETGSYPGQVWLWLYTVWYQVSPFDSSANADILVMTVMGVLSVGLLLIPFLPIIRDIPRWIPIHRLIWREHYRNEAH